METISNGKNIVLDLAGHTISIGKQNKFINNAKLEIVDNSIEKTGKLSFSNNKAIINNNELTLKNIIISNTYTNTGATNEFGGVIENTATMVVDGIIVEASVTKSAIFGNTNTGTLNIQNSQMKNLSYAAYTVIENKGQANITANDFQYVNIYNYDEGNIEISDINMLGGIKNYGTDIYEKGKSEPAIRIKSGNITTLYSRTIDYSTSNYDYPIENYSGEIIIEEDTDKTITIGPEGGTIKNNGGKITVNSGIVSQQITNNSGTIEINGGNITGRIMNEIDAIFNIYNGSINGSLGNAGIMNIGKDDVNISEISPMIILNNSLSNSKEGILGFYDGEIKITSASYVPVSGLVNDISDNSEIIYTIEDASSSYKLSKSTVVATIGDEKYYTLQSAFDACNTQEQKTIKLQKSVAVAEGSLYVIGVTQNIILDMNNNRIYGNCSNEIFTNEGTFEITDSTTGENAYITTNASGIILNKGKLKISGGIYTASKYGYSGGKQIVIQNKENGSIEMTGGKINVGGSYGAGRGYGIYSEYASGDIKVSGGIIECNNTTYAQYDSTAIYVYHSIMTLVEISGDAQLNNRAGGKPYQTFYTNGLNVTNANVTIKDNSIIKCRTNLIYNIDKPSTAKIEGGTITGTIQVQNSLGTLTVTGGTIGTLKSSGRTTNIQGGSITGTLSTGSNSATITGGTINCINAVDGDVVIKDNVEINTSVSAVTIDGANVTIKDNVSITSTESYGIVLKSGSLTLGEEEQPVKTESPAIKGKLNGVLVTKGIFKFYDGIISSTSTTAISGTVSDYPDLYAVTYTDSTNSTAILELISTKEEIISIGTSYYDNFNSAIEAIKIQVIKEL